MQTLEAADLFCGGGGFTEGLVEACDSLGVGLNLVAVNHWDTAIETHTANHPHFKHICATVESLDPRIAVPGGHLDILLAAPECTHHSSARGGRPINDQKRAPAWLILRWLEMLDVDTLLLENVPEFKTWGPLNSKGRPIKTKKGVIYEHFLQGIRNLGYTVEYRDLVAADYGAATTRKRLFIMAHKGKRKIEWPEQTHAKDGKGFPKWRAAREIIDFTLSSQSIFNRKKPLAPATMNRILAGLERFSPDLRPYLVTLRAHMDGRSLDSPVPTVTASGNHVGLAEPFLMHVTHGGRVHSIDEPVKTVTSAPRGELGVVEPVLTPVDLKSFLMNLSHGQRTHSLDEPLATITTAKGGELAICEPMLLSQQSGGVARPVSEPAMTVATDGAIGLIEASITKVGNGQTGSSAGASLPRDPVGGQHGTDLETQDADEYWRRENVDNPPVYGPSNEKWLHPGGPVVPAETVCDSGSSPSVARPQGANSAEDGRQSHRRRQGKQQPGEPGAGDSVGEPQTRLQDRDSVRDAEAAARTPLQSCIIKYYGTGIAHSVDDTLDACTTKARFGLAEPVLVEYHSERKPGEAARVRSVDEPLPTQTTANRFGLAEATLIPTYNERPAKAGRAGQKMRSHDINDPAPTIPASGGGKLGLAQAFLLPHRNFNEGVADSVDRPLRTITAAAGRCFGLVQPLLFEQPDGTQVLLDIRFRMLQNSELAGAMDFPADYIFKGKVTRKGNIRKEDITKQIGNAVDCVQARVLCVAALAGRIKSRKGQAA